MIAYQQADIYTYHVRWDDPSINLKNSLEFVNNQIGCYTVAEFILCFYMVLEVVVVALGIIATVMDAATFASLQSALGN